MQLLQRLIDACPVWPVQSAFMRLAPLKMGSQLTGGEVLQLLQQAASRGASGLLCFILELNPAVDERLMMQRGLQLSCKQLMTTVIVLTS
jgi:hypothetical protein